MEQFKIEHQWKLYLERAQVKDEDLPEDQRREMRRAFFGAVGQMLILMRDDMTDLADKKGDEKAVDMLQDMLNQVSNFWLNEQGRNG